MNKNICNKRLIDVHYTLKKLYFVIYDRTRKKNVVILL